MSVFSESAKVSRSSPAAVGCIGKVAFDSYGQVKAVLDRNQTKSRPGRSVYRCGHCGLWHIGSDKGHVAKKKAAEFKERKKA